MNKAIIIIIISIVVIIGAFLFINQSTNNQQTSQGESTIIEKPVITADSSTSSNTDKGELANGDIFTESNIKEFNVIAKQWEFVPNPIVVNEGDTVILNIKSIDVAHGIAIPTFGVSERLNPGKEIIVEFIADKKGTFTFFCNVQCGSGHSSMRGQLIVE